MNDIKATSDQDIKTLGTKGHDLIDPLFLRAVELMLLTLVLSSLVAWILLRRFSNRPPDRAEDSSAPHEAWEFYQFLARSTS